MQGRRWVHHQLPWASGSRGLTQGSLASPACGALFDNHCQMRYETPHADAECKPDA
jgi:hypothetical protein